MSKLGPKRGNDLLYQPQGNRDTFQHYHGPLGADVRQSIKGPHPENRDDPGGDGPVNVRPTNGRGKGNG